MTAKKDAYGLELDPRHLRAHRRAQKLLDNYRAAYRRNWHWQPESYDGSTEGDEVE